MPVYFSSDVFGQHCDDYPNEINFEHLMIQDTFREPNMKGE